MNQIRRNFLKKLISTAFLASIFPSNQLIIADARSKFPRRHPAKFKKIDIHTHISSDAQYLREVMEKMNLKMFTICNEGLKSNRLTAQKNAAVEICKDFPRYYAWCTTFDLNGINQAGWTDRVIEELEEDFNQGALAVKVWKEIGMQVKDSRNNFIQIDDPIFDPVLKFISNNNKTLFMHIGDPPDYWLKNGKDGLPDAWYKEGGGVWNRLGRFRGEVSYDRLMRARDNVLSGYPDLRIVDCHMGNMSFDVNQIANRLDRYPNYAVETSFTYSYLMGQAREKVRNFFLKYQDRILYGSDISGGLVASPFMVDMSKINERWSEEEIKELKIDLIAQYVKEFNYFETDHEFPRGNYSVQGLALSVEVLYKLYYANAVRWVPEMDKDF